MASGFREEGSAPKGSSRGKGPRWRSGRRSSARRAGTVSFRTRGMGLHLSDWLHWYDFVMVPLLILAAVMVVRNIQDVLLFFLRLTLWLLDMVLIVGFFALIILAIWMLVRRGRRRRW